MHSFRVLQIDHVEVFVPNRYEAAGWYRRVLGLETLKGYEIWAKDPKGPLMITSDGGSTKLALFEGQPQDTRPTAGFHRLAFRVTADGFKEFLGRLPDLLLKTHKGNLVTASQVVDHEMSYSIYFSDPYGHRLEITTYDYEAVRAALSDETACPSASS
jgi:catechol 2,3-dioxygenase-like lactoylglutathione lyase family enzyme